MNLKERARAFLTRRKQAYQQTFAQGPFSDVVLGDLARFCRATQPTFHQDARISERLEGRREVWLRIQEHLRLSEEDLWRLRGVAE